MDNPSAETTPSDRPSFFGLPPHWRALGRIGGRYWGGLLAGLGLGLLVARALAELEVPLTAWIGLAAIVLVGIGQVIAFRSVRRDQPADDPHGR